MVKFELWALPAEANDVKYIRYRSKADFDRIVAQRNARLLLMDDYIFYEIQKSVDGNVLQLETYYKYFGKSVLPAGMDAHWAKFLLLWNKRIVFTTNQCALFAPNILDASTVIHAIAGPTEISRKFTQISDFFQRAAAERRQLIYSPS